MFEREGPTREVPRPGSLLWGTPWRELRTVRRGERADVVLAEHAETKEPALVKVLRVEEVIDVEGAAEREKLGDRVRLEAEALRAVAHPAVLGPIDVGHTPDRRPYFATPVLAGARTLGEVLEKKGTLPLSETLRIVRQILSALGSAHDKGIVHRQVEPDSVVLANEYVFLGDFGLAKILEPHRAGVAPLVDPTTAGRKLGIPRYFAPEQALGKPVDARTDLYQVGLVLFECLAGRGPFDGAGETTAEQSLARSTTDAPSLGAIAPSVPKEVAAIVDRALARDPAQRFGSAAELEAALARVSGSVDDQAPTALMPAPVIDDGTARAEPGSSPPDRPVAVPKGAASPLLVRVLIGLVVGLVVLVLILFGLLTAR